MINNPQFSYMLKEAKSRAKQKEFGIDKKDYPNYKTDYKELDYSAVFILSKYAEAIIQNIPEEINEFYKDLKPISQYFNAATSIVREYDYSIDYLISGACAYFLIEDFGDSKALLLQLLNKNIENDIRRLLLSILLFVFNINDRAYLPSRKVENNIFNIFVHCLKNGENFADILDYIKNSYISQSLNSIDNSEIYYSQLLYAIIKKIENNSSWKLLPQLSGISVESWKSYLIKDSAPKILWTAQKIIGEYNIYKGENGIIQLPTGVGKTKSIELIIRSAFLSNRTKSVIIITPLRALCSEISKDMYKAFGKEIIINQLSDASQEDYDIQLNDNKYITVCTPEKLKYILHHDISAFNNVGLFIFDEGHLFDDSSRGAKYELLITSIKEIYGTNAQMVFISAVLKNVDDIARWLFGNKYNIVSSNTISTTEKNIGFVSFTENEIDYYENNNYKNINYYVKNVIKSNPLLTKTNKLSTKVFPENNTRDISLYLANLLCKNGSVAIFLQKANFIESYIKRISSIKSSNNLFTNISSDVDTTEQQKLLNLIKKHYGETSVYVSGIKLGLLPHYSNLEEGIKIAVENAIKNNYFKTIVCTSTLAQGVNIPIKYLLVTELDAYERNIRNMEVQNLIGRTARSGMYTEGSVIITDVQLYKNRFEKKGYRYHSGGKYNWEKSIGLLNSENNEPCGSCILNIFLPVSLHKNSDSISLGDKIIECIKNKNIEFKNFENLSIFKIYKNDDYYKNEFNNSLGNYLKQTRDTINCIESHICLLKSVNSQLPIIDIALNLCKSTLAYYLADEKIKNELIELFLAIANNIDQNSDLTIEAKSMSNTISIKKIKEWLLNNISDINKNNIENTLEKIFELFISFNDDICHDKEIYLSILNLWINGKTNFEISNEISKLFQKNLNYIKIEKFCREKLSYNLSFLVGNIVDIGVDSIQEDTKQKLQLLQKRIKYGLPSQTCISIFEKGICDRVIVQEISNIIDCSLNSEIVSYLKNNIINISNILSNYPSIFEDLFNKIIS